MPTRRRSRRREGLGEALKAQAGALGAASGVGTQKARGANWSGASVLDGARGQVVSAGGAFAQGTVLAGGGSPVVGSGGVVL